MQNIIEKAELETLDWEFVLKKCKGIIYKDMVIEHKDSVREKNCREIIELASKLKPNMKKLFL